VSRSALHDDGYRHHPDHRPALPRPSPTSPARRRVRDATPPTRAIHRMIMDHLRPATSCALARRRDGARVRFAVW